MIEIADAAPQSYAECELACLFSSNFDDFEDNLIIAAAETDKAGYVVTSDRLFFTRVRKPASLPTVRWLCWILRSKVPARLLNAVEAR